MILVIVCFISSSVMLAANRQIPRPTLPREGEKCRQLHSASMQMYDIYVRSHLPRLSARPSPSVGWICWHFQLGDRLVLGAHSKLSVDKQQRQYFIHGNTLHGNDCCQQCKRRADNELKQPFVGYASGHISWLEASRKRTTEAHTHS